MIAFVAVLLLQLAPPPDRCEQLYRRTEATRQQMIDEIRADGQIADSTLRQSTRQSRRARRCYGARRSDTVATLYQRELYALRRLHRSREALAVADSFLVRFSDTDRPGQLTFVQQQRGRLRAERGNIQQALADYTQALVFARRAEQAAWKRAELYVDMAQLYQEIDDFPAARQRYERAEKVLRSASLTDEQNVRMLARVMGQQVDLVLLWADRSKNYHADSLARAADQALEAARLNERIELPQSAGMSYLRAAEAEAYAGRPGEALPYMQKAMQLGEETGNLALRSAAAYKMARLRLQRREFDRAEVLLDRARELAEQRGDLDYQRRISIDRGLLHEMQRQWDEALRWYRRAAGLTERYRASLGSAEQGAQAFGNWYGQQPYRGQTRVLLQQSKPREAFRTLERSRAHYLRSLRRRSRMVKTLPRARRVRVDSLRRTLAATRDSLWRTPASEQRRATLKARAVRLVAALNDALDLPPDTSSFSIRATRRALAPRGRVLVSYFLDEGSGLFERPTVSRVFVLTRDTLRTVALDAPADTVRAMLRRVSPALSGTAPRSPGDVQFDLNGLHRLYRKLLAPADSLFPDGAPLVVVPDGPLYGFPFGSLITRETPPFAYRDAPYLLREHPVATESSATLLTASPDPDTARYDVVAFGRSEFASDSARTRSRFREANLPLRTGALGDLPAVPRELEALRNLFADVFTVLGEKATETAFYQRMSEGRVLHLASHVVVNATEPQRSAIVLSEEEKHREDGILHLHELQHRSLEAPLVVLSGCNTARGPLRTGEGMAGLQYGFRAMGVESLLATLWLAEDDATARLMRDFYRRLREGRPKDEALRQAQLAYLKDADAERASPFFWAAPVLYGQTRSLALAPRQDGFFTGKWTIAGLVFLTVLGLLWWRMRDS
jgi:CHAT domain-containing protein